MTAWVSVGRVKGDGGGVVRVHMCARVCLRAAQAWWMHFWEIMHIRGNIALRAHIPRDQDRFAGVDPLTLVHHR